MILLSGILRILLLRYDGRRGEFHIHDDDVLVVYFKRVGRRTIRLVGVYGHESIPG